VLATTLVAPIVCNELFRKSNSVEDEGGDQFGPRQTCVYPIGQ
jgi:hypothetical protein